MGDFFVNIIFHQLFNFIGALIRYVYGSIWRSIFKKPKFSFKEYLNGPKKSSGFFDEFAHKGNNVMIGLIFVFMIVAIIIKLNYQF